MISLLVVNFSSLIMLRNNYEISPRFVSSIFSVTVVCLNLGDQKIGNFVFLANIDMPKNWDFHILSKHRYA